MSDLDSAGAELGLVCYLSGKVLAMGVGGMGRDVQGHQLDRDLGPGLGSGPKTWLDSALRLRE